MGRTPQAWWVRVRGVIVERRGHGNGGDGASPSSRRLWHRPRRRRGNEKASPTHGRRAVEPVDNVYGSAMVQLRCRNADRRGRSSVVERQLPKLNMRVRFPPPAPIGAFSMRRVSTKRTGNRSSSSARSDHRLQIRLRSVRNRRDALLAACGHAPAYASVHSTSGPRRHLVPRCSREAETFKEHPGDCAGSGALLGGRWRGTPRCGYASENAAFSFRLAECRARSTPDRLSDRVEGRVRLEVLGAARGVDPRPGTRNETKPVAV